MSQQVMLRHWSFRRTIDTYNSRGKLLFKLNLSCCIAQCTGAAAPRNSIHVIFMLSGARSRMDKTRQHTISPHALANQEFWSWPSVLLPFSPPPTPLADGRARTNTGQPSACRGRPKGQPMREHTLESPWAASCSSIRASAAMHQSVVRAAINLSTLSPMAGG